MAFLIAVSSSRRSTQASKAAGVLLRRRKRQESGGSRVDPAELDRNTKSTRLCVVMPTTSGRAEGSRLDPAGAPDRAACSCPVQLAVRGTSGKLARKSPAEPGPVHPMKKGETRGQPTPLPRSYTRRAERAPSLLRFHHRGNCNPPHGGIFGDGRITVGTALCYYCRMSKFEVVLLSKGGSHQIGLAFNAENALDLMDEAMRKHPDGHIRVRLGADVFAERVPPRTPTR